MPGGRHLWECNHTPSLSDVVKLSVEGSPPPSGVHQQRVVPPGTHQGCLERAILQLGCSLQLGGREEELNPLDLRSDKQVAVLYHVMPSSGTATEGSVQCHTRATPAPCPGGLWDNQEQSRGEGCKDVEAVREENECAAIWALAMLPALSPVTLHDPDAHCSATT